MKDEPIRRRRYTSMASKHNSGKEKAQHRALFGNPESHSKKRKRKPR